MNAEPWGASEHDGKMDQRMRGLLVLAPGQMELVDTAFRELTSDGRTNPPGSSAERQ
jgi:hypothetical protein